MLTRLLVIILTAYSINAMALVTCDVFSFSVDNKSSAALTMQYSVKDTSDSSKGIKLKPNSVWSYRNGPYSFVNHPISIKIFDGKTLVFDGTLKKDSAPTKEFGGFSLGRPIGPAGGFSWVNKRASNRFSYTSEDVYVGSCSGLEAGSYTLVIS